MKTNYLRTALLAATTASLVAGSGLMAASADTHAPLRRLPVAPVVRHIPDVPVIQTVERSCVDASTILRFFVLRYDAATKSFAPADGVQRVDVYGRGGGVAYSKFVGTNPGWSKKPIATVFTEQFGGGGTALVRSANGQVPFQFKLVLSDGTSSPIRQQAGACINP